MGPMRITEPVDLLRLNNTALIRLAVVLGLSMAVALAAPPVLFAATLSSFLGLAALAIAVAAALAREPVWQPHLTRWDIAAMLHGIALFSGFFIDAAAVEDFLRLHGARPH